MQNFILPPGRVPGRSVTQVDSTSRREYITDACYAKRHFVSELSAEVTDDVLLRTFSVWVDVHS